MRKCDVGGQAVIEGVMMRGSKGMATAIRTPKGKINVSVKIGCCQSNSKESLYISNLANYGIRHSCILSDGAKPVTE